MQALFSITILLTVPLPLSAVLPEVCARVLCAVRECSHEVFIPVGKCCPVCKVSLTILLTVPIPLLCTHISLDCSAVSCLKPDCDVIHVPQGKCCPVCGPDCSKAVCPLIRCQFGSYLPKGRCCPACKPDCSTVPCRAIGCLFGSYTPEGQCCPVCKKDCSSLSCPNDSCRFGSYKPEGECCPFCKPDCLSFICPKIECLPGESYIPFGQCCPACYQSNQVKPGVCPNAAGKIGVCVDACEGDHACPADQKCCSNGCGKTCQAPTLDCSKVLCPLIRCQFGSYIPEGKCCPTCKPDCSWVACPAIGCLFGSYIPEGKCCPVCKKDCSRISCPKISCPSGSYKPDGQCCPFCKSDCLNVRCPQIKCLPGESYIPFGQCCPVCFQDCSGLSCPQKRCRFGSYKPEGQCCAFCKPDCLSFICPKIECLPGESYIPFGQCCPVCYQSNQVKAGECPNVGGKIGICMDTCAGDHTCQGDQKCCSNGCGKTCQAPASETCPNGQNGTCGSIAGNICPDNTECMFKGNYPDAAGKCCIKKPKPLTACTQPLKVGPCRAAISRYFYNTTSCKCELFSWGGCQPNENNFFDLAYCQASCELPMQSNPVCELDKMEGICKFNWNIDRWRFNKVSCKCELYKWNGCGNANNFVSKELCESNCGCYNCKGSTNICDLPIKPDGGGPIVCLAYIPSYGYNTKTCRCEKFIYSGCGGNENRFDTFALCERRCGNNKCEAPVFCDQPVDEGSCDDKITRYFYNKKTCKCQKFVWTGCGGNSNNFKTANECKKYCKGEPCGNPKPNCLLPKEIGPCEALVKRFYFDKIECKCKMFNYGGCQGNSNNFPTLKKCKQSCRDTSCPVCNLHADTGPCKAAFKRFFYNTQTCQCEEFTYGGCRGNGNRYETKEECENMCGSYPCVRGCLEAKKVGPCKAAIKRFYYNPLKNKCEKFTWGGCQPNGNNFESKKFCNKACKHAVCSLPVKVGPCKARKKRYYYNSNTKECELFFWGGCESNGNNFKTAKACRKVCA